MDDIDRIVGFNKTGKAEDGAVPRVAVQTHLDGDPKPRAKEIASWNDVRRQHGLDEFLCQILLPDPLVVGGPMPGYAAHWWRLFERDGEPVVEPTEVDLQIVPDGGPDATSSEEQTLLAPATASAPRVKVTREDDDSEGVLRVSIGGTPELGAYFVYRGDPEQVLDLVREALVEAEAQLRPISTAQITDSKGRPADWDEITRRMVDLDRDQFAFRVTRSKRDDRTFSAVALEGLMRQVLAFALGRCKAYWTRTGKPPRDLTLYADLRLDHRELVAEQDAADVNHWPPIVPLPGPYGTNEGDIWTMEGSEVGDVLAERDNAVGIHEMLRDPETGVVEERIYTVDLDNPDPAMQAHIAKARKGTDLWLEAQAANN